MPYIDPIIAGLSGIGLLTCMVAAMRGGRRAIYLYRRFQMWRRWRVVMRRGYRPEVA